VLVASWVSPDGHILRFDFSCTPSLAIQVFLDVFFSGLSIIPHFYSYFFLKKVIQIKSIFHAPCKKKLGVDGEVGEELLPLI